MPSRPLFPRLRRPGGWARAWLGLMLALAVALKLLVPHGWMPAPGGGLMLCPDQAPVVPTAPITHGGGHHAVAGTHVHAEADQQPDHPMPSGERCAFAGVGLAALARLPAPALVVPAPLPIASPTRVPAVAIGRGLAAPPPPSTGPPASA